MYTAVLERARAHALAHLESLDRAHVSGSATKGDLRGRLGRPLPDCGADPIAIIDDLIADTDGGLTGSAGGRFFGWVVGGSLPSALAADWLTSVWDQNAALYASGPAVAIIEEVCGRWLEELLGLPRRASFALVTGCQMAHVTCLAAARNSLLARHDWDLERRGLSGAPRIHLLTGNQRHGSVDRAVRALGLGTDCVVALPVDERGRLTASSLARALEERPNEPKIVHLQAGDVNTGAFDPFEELIPLAHEHGAWVHVDGAFGLWVNTSPKYRHLLAGAGSADSWSTDGHKWLNVPYDSGYAFVADPDAHHSSMSYRASYLTHDEDAREPMDWNLEWSRRGRGVATYAAIRELGRQGIAGLVERTCHYARELVTRIAALDGAEMVWEPLINQGLVRFPDPRRGATEEDHARRTDEIIGKIVRTGEALFGGTTWHTKRCMRVSVSSWQTDDADVDRVVTAVKKVLAGC
jgi:glutamate/tyrosine decarboxylase-like PLP-dependent enzyme